MKKNIVDLLFILLTIGLSAASLLTVAFMLVKYPVISIALMGTALACKGMDRLINKFHKKENVNKSAPLQLE